MNQILKGFFFFGMFSVFMVMLLSQQENTAMLRLSFSSFAKKTFQDIELPKYKVNSNSGTCSVLWTNLRGHREMCSLFLMF